jgi:hypothetical protein
MANTLSDFRTQIRRYLKEIDPNTSFWDQPFVDQLFNAQYRKRCMQLIMAEEGWFTNVSTGPITAGTSRYAFPDGFLRLQKMELVRSDGTTQPIQRYERRYEMNPDNSNSGASGDVYRPFYRPVGNGFVLEPTPSETVANGIQLEWTGTPVLLSAPGDFVHPSFPSIFEELLVIDTVVNAFDAEGVQESGLVRSLLRQRAELEEHFERYIEMRVVSQTGVVPFNPHYQDS